MLTRPRPMGVGGMCSSPQWNTMDSDKDEVCKKCGTLFEAHIHFVRCDAPDCPMRSTKERRSILERLTDTQEKT